MRDVTSHGALRCLQLLRLCFDWLFSSTHFLPLPCSLLFLLTHFFLRNPVIGSSQTCVPAPSRILQFACARCRVLWLLSSCCDWPFSIHTLRYLAMLCMIPLHALIPAQCWGWIPANLLPRPFAHFTVSMLAMSRLMALYEVHTACVCTMIGSCFCTPLTLLLARTLL